MEYLGYVVSEQVLSADSAEIDAVQKFAVPKDVKSLQYFLGLVSYYGSLYFQDSKSPLFSHMERCPH